MKTDARQFLPLSSAAFYILLALAGDDLHGYGIIQQVTRQSSGHYKLGPGTLYDNLKKLMTFGLVAQSANRLADDDPRRRYYRLTALGRSVFAEEVKRLEGALRQARAHLAFGPRRT
ncbi:MAG TPA: PadR family transcriptional regulator [Candidatus Methylomirabilis sp.]|nr:PadR family transcriptional regulator [Candidatus Methylomirabilis sp.]